MRSIAIYIWHSWVSVKCLSSSCWTTRSPDHVIFPSVHPGVNWSWYRIWFLHRQFKRQKILSTRGKTISLILEDTAPKWLKKAESIACISWLTRGFLVCGHQQLYFQTLRDVPRIGPHMNGLKPPQSPSFHVPFWLTNIMAQSSPPSPLSLGSLLLHFSKVGSESSDTQRNSDY